MASGREKATGTQQRLLEAACVQFAEKGFHEATIAEICEQAGANTLTAVQPDVTKPAAPEGAVSGEDRGYDQLVLTSTSAGTTSGADDGGQLGGSPPPESGGAVVTGTSRARREINVSVETVTRTNPAIMIAASRTEGTLRHVLDGGRPFLATPSRARSKSRWLHSLAKVASTFALTTMTTALPTALAGPTMTKRFLSTL